MKHRWLYNLVLLGLITYFWVPALFSLRSASSAPGPEINPAPVIEAKKKAPAPFRPLEDYKIIAERNLFGGSEEEDSAPEEEVTPEEIPLALKNLGLKLVGTVVVDEPGKSVAIIENQRARKQEVFQEGDQVGQVLIKKIVRNNVIINKGAEELRLTMEFDEKAASTPAKGQAIRKQRSTKSQRSARSRRTARSRRSSSSKPPAMEASPIRLEQEEVTSALADTDKLMEEMQIKPFKEGTDPGGFKIGKVKPGSIFAKMGLRPGDVVTGVNNEAITGVEQAEDLYSSLLEGGDIALEVKRGGRTQKLQLAIE
jgi:type II secretion system protein C